MAKIVTKLEWLFSSKGKGKSGGARVIAHFVVTDLKIFLLAIYDKTEKQSITDKELQELLRMIP